MHSRKYFALAFIFGRQIEYGVFGMSEEINNTIFVYSGTGHPDYLPSVFSLEFERSHLESNEGERKTETKRGAVIEGAYLLSYLSRFIISHCRREPAHCWRAREGPRRISKTVSDRICIENAERTRAVHPITGPINCGLSLFSPGPICLFLELPTVYFFRRVQSISKV